MRYVANYVLAVVMMSFLIIGCSTESTSPLAVNGSKAVGDITTTDVMNDNWKYSDIPYTNPCIPEEVMVSGSAHFSWKTKTMPDGTTIDLFSLSGVGEGIGATTGDKYRIHDKFTDETVIENMSLPLTWTMHSTQRIHGPGQSNDYELLYHFTFHLDEDGNLTSELVLDGTCK